MPDSCASISTKCPRSTANASSPVELCRSNEVPEVSWERDLKSASEEPGFELGVGGEVEPALLPKTLDERGDLGFRIVRDLNLYPS